MPHDKNRSLLDRVDILETEMERVNIATEPRTVSDTDVAGTLESVVASVNSHDSDIAAIRTRLANLENLVGDIHKVQTTQATPSDSPKAIPETETVKTT